MTVSGGRRAEWAHDSSGVRNSNGAATDRSIVLPRLGEKIVITGRHAEGAICEVFKAHHTSLDIAVAVKVLRPEYASDRHFVERMRIEAQVLPRMRSRHIPHCFDCGYTLCGRPFTVLEFLRGETLDTLLERAGRLGALEVVELGTALLEALSVAHARGIVHRDVSLRNLVVHHAEHEPPTLKLIDFGFACILPDAPESAPEPATTADSDLAVGTPRFTSPEVALGKPNIDARADLYSTGVVLYSLLAGRDPFSDYRGTAAVLEAHAHRAPPRLSHHAPSVSKRIEHVIMRLLEKNPEHRYATAAEAAQALLEAGNVTRRSSAPVQAVPPPPSGPATIKASATVEPPSTPAFERPIVRNRDTDHCVATWDNVLILLWSGEVTAARVARLSETARSFTAERRGLALGSVLIVETTSPTPSEPVRASFAAFFRDLLLHVKQQIVVAEGGSFRMALVRCVGAHLSNMTPKALPFAFTQTVDHAAELLAPVLSGRSGGPKALMEAIQSLRNEPAGTIDGFKATAEGTPTTSRSSP